MCKKGKKGLKQAANKYMRINSCLLYVRSFFKYNLLLRISVGSLFAPSVRVCMCVCICVSLFLSSNLSVFL